MESITQEPKGRPIDISVAIGQHISRATRMSVGWQPGTVITAGDWFKVKVSRKYWLIVKLNAQDTYDVEVGRLRKKDGLPTYTPLQQAHGVYAEQLSATVRALGDRA